jgi:hypothetical protein
LISGNQSDSTATEAVAMDFEERGGFRRTAIKRLLEVGSDGQM